MQAIAQMLTAAFHLQRFMAETPATVISLRQKSCLAAAVHMPQATPHLGNREAAMALHQACQVMVHVVKHHVDTALEVVHPVHCRPGTKQTSQPASRAGPGNDAVQLTLCRCRGMSQQPGQALAVA